METLRFAVARVNSKEMTMEGAPFFKYEEFYVPLRFAAETLGWHYAEDGDTITLSATKTWEWGVDFAPDGGYFLRPCDPRSKAARRVCRFGGTA